MNTELRQILGHATGLGRQSMETKPRSTGFHAKRSRSYVWAASAARTLRRARGQVTPTRSDGYLVGSAMPTVICGYQRVRTDHERGRSR